MPGVWNAFKIDKVTAKLSAVKEFCRPSKNIANHEIIVENTNISKTFFTLRLSYALVADTTSQTVRRKILLLRNGA